MDENIVSITIEMSTSVYKELEAEADLRLFLEQLRPDVSLIDKLAVMYVLGVTRRLNVVTLRKE